MAAPRACARATPRRCCSSRAAISALRARPTWAPRPRAATRSSSSTRMRACSPGRSRRSSPRSKRAPGPALPAAHLLLDTTLGRLPARCRRRPHRVDWVYGTFMAVRTAVFRQLGGFDPRYFVYGEDLDLCYRAAAAGLRTIHVPEARAVHGGNVSAVQRFGSGRAAAVVEGELRFYATLGPGALRRFRAVATAKFALKALLAAALGRRAAAAASARVVRACLVAPGSS